MGYSREIVEGSYQEVFFGENNKILPEQHKISDVPTALVQLIDSLASFNLAARELAIEKIWRNYNIKHYQEYFAKSGMIPSLIEVLTRGSSSGKEYAAALVVDLSTNSASMKSLFEAGVVSPLIKILYEGNIRAKTFAAMAIGHFAVDDVVGSGFMEKGTTHPLIWLLKSRNLRAKEAAAGAIADLGKNNRDRAISFVLRGVIPPLIILLSKEIQSGDRCAVGAVMNLSAYPENRLLLLSAGTVPLLIKLLETEHKRDKENIIAAIANLAGTSENATLVRDGVIPPLIKILEQGSDIEKERAAAAIANLAVNNKNEDALIEAKVIPALRELLVSGTDRVKNSAVGAIWNLTKFDESQILLMEMEVIPLLITMLKDGTEIGKEKAAAAAAICNLCWTSNKQIGSVVIERDVIPVLLDNISVEHCRHSIFNLLAGGAISISALQQLGVIKIVVEFSKSYKEDKWVTRIIEIFVEAEKKGKSTSMEKATTSAIDSDSDSETEEEKKEGEINLQAAERLIRDGEIKEDHWFLIEEGKLIIQSENKRDVVNKMDVSKQNVLDFNGDTDRDIYFLAAETELRGSENSSKGRKPLVTARFQTGPKKHVQDDCLIDTGATGCAISKTLCRTTDFRPHRSRIRENNVSRIHGVCGQVTEKHIFSCEVVIDGKICNCENLIKDAESIIGRGVLQNFKVTFDPGENETWSSIEVKQVESSSGLPTGSDAAN